VGSMKIIEVAFFAYATNDMKRAREFYELFLGLKPNNDYPGTGNANWIEYDIGATTLGVGHAPEMWNPSPDGGSAAFEVDDFDAWKQRIEDFNVKVRTGPYDFPSCKSIMIYDPDGNTVTLHQRKKK
jgi:predicted enzyme related to lactoylglutathione lyase